MKTDIILAGVGGQGVLSIATIIAQAAVTETLSVRQSEVHGMAQRGGAVLAHLRIAKGPIFSDLVPKGEADLIIAMEPLESLRYASWLSPTGVLVSAVEPLVNIPDYPQVDIIYQTLARFPRYRLTPASRLAKEAGLTKAVNIVMVGAASPFLPVSVETLEHTIEALFASKAPALGEANLRAFRLGRDADAHGGLG